MTMNRKGTLKCSRHASHNQECLRGEYEYGFLDPDQPTDK